MKLNQLIALEKGVRSAADAVLTDAYQSLQKPAPLAGISRTYTPKNDGDEVLPSEKTLVQISATSFIDKVSEAFKALFDNTASKEATNADDQARANVVVDGNVLIKDATVPFLLFLEKRLVDFRTFIKKLPVLDPADTWHFDSAVGCYVSEPVQTVRTKKVPRNHVKAEATDKHPAQVEMWMEDIPVGTWTTTKFSGALEQSRVNEMLARVDKLSAAVKVAREQANLAMVVESTPGKAIVDYLFS